MEKRNIGLGQQANHFSPCVLLPSSAPPPTPLRLLRGTPTSLCPSARVRPDSRVGGGKAGHARAQQQEPRASLPLRLLCLSGLCSRLPRAPAQPIAVCVPGSSIAWCFCGCLSPSSWPPASPSLRVPLLLQAHPTLLLQQKQPLVYPPCFAPSRQPLALTVPRVAFCASVLFQAPLCSPSHVGCDVGRLGRLDLLCKFVVPLPCCCPGPSLAPPFTVCFQSLSPPLLAGGHPALLWI